MEEIPICSRENTNLHNPFAVKVLKSETIVSHLPRSISSVCSLFLERRINIIDKETWGFGRHIRLFVFFFFFNKPTETFTFSTFSLRELLTRP